MSMCHSSEVSEITEGTSLFSSKTTGIPNNNTGMFSGKGQNNATGNYSHTGGLNNNYPSGHSYTGGSNYRFKKNTMYYDYCNFKGYTRVICYKLNGYPLNFKTKKKVGLGNTTHFAQETTCATGNNQTFAAIFASTSHVQHGAMPGQRTQNVMLNIPQFTQDQYQQIIQLLEKRSTGNNSTTTTPLPIGMPSCGLRCLE